jgi:hypothetical protein
MRDNLVPVKATVTGVVGEGIDAVQALTLDPADPRRNDGKPRPIGPPSRYPDMDYKWIVEGWNDGIGSGRTAYMQGWTTGEQAAAYADELWKNGDASGMRYQHYDVSILAYEVIVVQKTYTPEEARKL